MSYLDPAFFLCLTLVTKLYFLIQLWRTLPLFLLNSVLNNSYSFWLIFFLNSLCTFSLNCSSMNLYQQKKGRFKPRWISKGDKTWQEYFGKPALTLLFIVFTVEVFANMHQCVFSVFYFAQNEKVLLSSWIILYFSLKQVNELRRIYGKIVTFPKKQSAFTRWLDGETFGEIARTARVAEATAQVYVIDMIARRMAREHINERLIREMDVKAESIGRFICMHVQPSYWSEEISNSIQFHPLCFRIVFYQYAISLKTVVSLVL